MPPTKMMICHTSGIPVPSWIRRIVRASVSGFFGLIDALASDSFTFTSAGEPLPLTMTVHSAFFSVGHAKDAT